MRATRTESTASRSGSSVVTKLAAGGRAVRLDGYRLQPPNTIEVLGLNRNRIVLLVVPPHTDPDRAHATLMAAAAPDNDSTVDGLLMISLRIQGIPYTQSCRRKNAGTLKAEPGDSSSASTTARPACPRVLRPASYTAGDHNPLTTQYLGPPDISVGLRGVVRGGLWGVVDHCGSDRFVAVRAEADLCGVRRL